MGALGTRPDRQVRLRVPVGFEPRVWAKQAYAAYTQHPFKDFSVNACPGAGKTKFAVMLAYNELRRGTIDRIDIVGPSVHICDQWMREFASWGLALDPENAHESNDCVGRVFTYQRLGMDVNSFIARDRRRTLVILDEVHHAGDSKTWGEALRLVYGAAHRRLMLSGTPFRSDNNPIPFVRYQDGDSGLSVSDYTYGYGEALRDGYCAPLYFPHHDGEFEWERDGKSFSASFSTFLERNLEADRLRTALEPSGAYVQGLLREAHAQLMELRQTHPAAAGILFGRDVENVQQLADTMRQMTGIQPVIVTNDLTEAGSLIREFREARTPWIVSVKMISEGVDIPRLRVGVFLSNVRTELFFRQAAGRLVRLVQGLEDQSGYLYIPSDPRLVRYAVEMQTERKHFLELRQKLLEGELELLAAQREDRASDSEDVPYRFLRSQGNRVGVIDSGPPASGDGQGLFDFTVEMMPELLEPVPAAPAPAAAPLLHEQKDRIRKRGGRISSLVNDVSARHGLSFRQVHGRLNRSQGVRSQSECTLDQLLEREQWLEKWLRQGSL
ncbi:DEAD/DEAH box helicase family protein [bacterium]|nr:DEAD/DEAH box helicase family protein [bacterium]